MLAEKRGRKLEAKFLSVPGLSPRQRPVAAAIIAVASEWQCIKLNGVQFSCSSFSSSVAATSEPGLTDDSASKARYQSHCYQQHLVELPRAPRLSCLALAVTGWLTAMARRLSELLQHAVPTSAESIALAQDEELLVSAAAAAPPMPPPPPPPLPRLHSPVWAVSLGNGLLPANQREMRSSPPWPPWVCTQVPRLVARIAELEGELYCSQADGADDSAAGGLLDRFGGLLRKAQAGLDAGISYV